MNRHSSAVEYMRRPAMIRHANSLRSVTALSHRSVTVVTPIPQYHSTASFTLLSGMCDRLSHVGGSATQILGSTLAMGISPFRS